VIEIAIVLDLDHGRIDSILDPNKMVTELDKVERNRSTFLIKSINPLPLGRILNVIFQLHVLLLHCLFQLEDILHHFTLLLQFLLELFLVGFLGGVLITLPVRCRTRAARL